MSIREIAQKAGVSVSTVSRALNGYSDVSMETRKRVMEVAREFNYFPNAIARGLVLRKTHMIGLFFGDRINSGFDDPMYQEVISAIRIEAGKSGRDLLIFANSNKELSTYTSLSKERGVDGVFLILNREEKLKKDQIRELEKSGIPCVSINFQLQGDRCTYVESNNYQGTKDAVTHLIRLGHKRIAFIGGDIYGKAGVDRLNGYKDALLEAGLAYDERLVEFCYFTNKGARDAAIKLQERADNITGIFVASDRMAVIVIDTLRERGLFVPSDISVVGFDDIAVAERSNPALTTVRQQRYEMGRLATEFLNRMIDDPDCRPEPTTLQCELVIRNSTASIRV
ncbi:LacI family DNA-binding transcriptional regulator [Paenibacillus piri]|nr:LacI family DNA-binding transcriptional regulator [Paenibacillus piri]